MSIENATIIVNRSRLESLVHRFNTRAQARFYIEHSGGNFRDYELEHDTFYRSLEKVVESLRQELKIRMVERKFVPNFLFGEKDLVVVVGQDGLVANAAKYVKGLPILGVNPDTDRYDGVLLPFNIENFELGWKNLLKGKATFKEVTLAEARTNDGQALLAFNDFFIGPSSHTSARYKLTHAEKSEDQSSSGIIVSTGAGSTGWLSSVLNMTNGVTLAFGNAADGSGISFSLPWDTSRLAFVVREPFRSKHSGVELSAGLISRSEKLVVESYMPSGGVVFSDGIEADFIQFNSGVKVEIGVAPERARIVIGDR